MVCFLRMIQAWPHFHGEPTPTRTTEPRASDPRRSDNLQVLPAPLGCRGDGSPKRNDCGTFHGTPRFLLSASPSRGRSSSKDAQQAGHSAGRRPPEDTGDHPGVFPGFTDKELTAPAASPVKQDAALQHSDARICHDVLLSISKRFHDNPRPGFSTLGSPTPTAP